MDRKQELALFAVLLLGFSAAAGLNQVDVADAEYVPWVWHNSGITILSNGTVTPSNAPIRVQGNIYTLTSDVFSGIAVLRNDTILEGNGVRMFGPMYGTGILLQDVINVTVQNVNVQYFAQGIYLDNASSCVIQGNTMTGCDIEVAHNSADNKITHNTVTQEIRVNFCQNNTVTHNLASSICTSWASNITIEGNTVSDAKRSDAMLNQGNYTEGIYVDNSENCLVLDNKVERKNVGVDIWQSRNITLKANTLQDNQVGFKLWGADLPHNLHTIDLTNTVNGKPVYFLVNISDYQVPADAGWIAAVNCNNITVQNWNSTPNWDGVLFVETGQSQIANCMLEDNFNGIRLQNASSCTLIQNQIVNNQYAALQIEQTCNCTIFDNQVFGNYCFFDVWHNATGNQIYGNDFVGNWTGPIGAETRNQWDNEGQGNYWSTFTGIDRDQNGISDSPYILNTESSEADQYPLMKPLSQPPQAQTSSGGLLLSMPEEYLNYTIVNVDGALWAQIDGVYPIHMSEKPTDPVPMLYPTPPGTVNMHIKLDGAEQSWSNYSEVDPSALHYTDIGNWEMVYCTIQPSLTDFLLEIHYEHPVEVINGSSTFLYDLNIAPYLSASSAISTAHFRVQLPVNQSNVAVFTTGYSGSWSPLDVNSENCSEGVILTFDVVSEYGKPLWGDIAFVMSNNQIPEFTFGMALGLIAGASLAFIGVYLKDKPLKQRK
ncbi:MAG: nitrous oxide reductase family maturation protein NosD [Candidatus Bathyarchaeia archaeon]